MNLTKTPAGVTFAVDDVAPAVAPLRECKTYEAVKQVMGGDAIESCCDYSDNVVAGVEYHPLLAAVYIAFNEHRPLVLTPDVVWLTIARGVADHMRLHAERLRGRFVAHEGRLKLCVDVAGFVKGSPENPWADAFAGWADRIRGHVGDDVYSTLVCDFGTTGPVERAASHVVMMDVFERYFRYEAVGICGIPAVTLEGTADDWRRLREKARRLSAFDLDWWLAHLLPICDQFVLAAEGRPDRGHWQRICKLREQYGGHEINGWVCSLFPYLRNHPDGPARRRNPVFETGRGMTTFNAPSALSRVPFTWVVPLTGKQCNMEAIGGLVGVTRDRHSLALRPKAGWAVREAAAIDGLLRRLEDEGHRTRPGVAAALRAEERAREQWVAKLDRADRPTRELLDADPEVLIRMLAGLPEDMGRFYHRTDGAELVGRDGQMACTLLPLADCDSVPRDIFKSAWVRFARLPDGSSLAIRTHASREHTGGGEVYWVCHFRDERWGRPGGQPLVARSFTEVLRRLLDAGGPPYWMDPAFEPYGDAQRVG